MVKQETRSPTLPLLILAGAIAVTLIAVRGVADFGRDLLGGNEPVTVNGMLVPPNNKDQIKACTMDQVINDRRCEIPIVIINAAEGEMPYIARNIREAWREGKPSLLHKGLPGDTSNRKIACSSARKKVIAPASCEEYPFNMSVEGGEAARTAGVPLAEQWKQGAAISNTTKTLSPGDEFLVVIVNPDQIPDKDYTP